MSFLPENINNESVSEFFDAMDRDDYQVFCDHFSSPNEKKLDSLLAEMYGAISCMATGEGLPPGTTLERILAKADTWIWRI